jgi:hypothetical protein
VWAISAAMIAITLERRLVPTAIGYFGVIALTIAAPEPRLYWVTLGNLVFTINTVWIWWPRTRSA